MWIFGRFLQCSAAGISQKRWGFVPSLGSSKLVNGGLKVERDLAAMTWSMWLPRVAVYCLLFSVHRERCLQLIYFLLVPLPEWFASTMAESAGPLRRMVSGQHQTVLSRRWVAPFSRISKKRSEMGEGRSAVPSFFVPRFLEIPCRASRVTYDMVRRSFHPVLQLHLFVVLVGNCHPLVLQDNVMRFSNSQWLCCALFHQLWLCQA